ncbi:MAG: aminoglycoside phosphotransferase family protein [Anaerolineae bacterium]|nr:aminoglycoside phosphotransferase family protein [Anaerolineae bacterium]
MLEKPNLADEIIIAHLRDQYAIQINALEFLPIGNDTNAWVYRVEASETYFLKVKRGTLHTPSVIVPRYLKDSGIDPIVPPLPTQSGQLWHPIENFTLILYPFMEGETGFKAGMSDAHWIELGTALRRIHALPLTPILEQTMRMETFSPRWIATIHKMDKLVETEKYDNPLREDLAAFWKTKRDPIRQIIQRTETIAQHLKASPPPFALCHADIHVFNVLITPQKQLFIVDWDETIYAPKERDLMFVSAGVWPSHNSDHQADMFFQGYGSSTVVDPVVMAYYRYEWAVQEISEWAERALLVPDLGDETIADAVRGFKSLFNPGAEVDVAFQSEAMLPEGFKSLRVW